MHDANEVCKAALVGLYALTPLQPGAPGPSAEIEVPVQREAHTGWPVCYASGVKGAWREAASARLTGADKVWVDVIFGADAVQGSVQPGTAGALAVTDAQVLLLPVRSLWGHFRWVTCPSVLRRFRENCGRVGLADLVAELEPVVAPEDDAALSALGIDSNAKGHPDPISLEEFEFKLVHADLGKWTQLLGRMVDREYTAGSSNVLDGKWLVVSDDVFTFLSGVSTEKRTRVKLAPDTKTNEALWTEEVLTPETLLYTIPVALPSLDAKPEQVLQMAISAVNGKNPHLRIGAGETLGMGWCRTSVLGIA